MPPAGENLIRWELQAGVLSTEDMGGSAGLRPGGVVVVVMGKFHWRPQTLE